MFYFPTTTTPSFYQSSLSLDGTLPVLLGEEGDPLRSSLTGRRWQDKGLSVESSDYGGVNGG